MTVEELINKIEEICDNRDSCSCCPLNEITTADAVCVTALIADAKKVVEEYERREDEKDS